MGKFNQSIRFIDMYPLLQLRDPIPHNNPLLQIKPLAIAIKTSRNFQGCKWIDVFFVHVAVATKARYFKYWYECLRVAPSVPEP